MFVVSKRKWQQKFVLLRFGVVKNGGRQKAGALLASTSAEDSLSKMCLRLHTTGLCMDYFASLQCESVLEQLFT